VATFITTVNLTEKGIGSIRDTSKRAAAFKAAAARLATASCKEEVAALLRGASDLFRELNGRWLEVTQRVFAIQARLQEQLSQAAGALRAADGGA
jgi:hypothetical protein